MTTHRLPPGLAEAQTVLCSACLLGFACRYDGGDKRMGRVARALEGKAVVPVCPEASGGLPTPRQPSDLEGGSGEAVLEGKARVVARDGSDVTSFFLRGAALALQAAERYGATVALLKEASPSCGAHRIHLSGELVEGRGVTAAALGRAGVVVISDEDLPE